MIFFLLGGSQAGLQQQTGELEQKLDTMMLLMGGLGLLETDAHPHQDTGVKAAGTLTAHWTHLGYLYAKWWEIQCLACFSAVCHSAPVAEREPERLRASVSPAVLLASPRQRNNSHSPGNSLFYFI